MSHSKWCYCPECTNKAMYRNAIGDYTMSETDIQRVKEMPLNKLPDAKPVDPVNHPSHYTFSKIEVLDAIEAWGLPYHLGNVVKYIVRAPFKGNRIEDLKKAQFYLNRYIETQEVKG